MRGTQVTVAGLLMGLLMGPAGAGAVQVAAAYQPQVGDIVFHTSTSAQSLAVQQATRSPLSHMGLVLIQGGQPVVLEAVQPVKYTPLKRWLERGKGGHHVIQRLHRPLTKAEQAALHQRAQAYVGKPYDLTFEWSDDRIYCSELVWKLYRDALGIELAPLARLKAFDLTTSAVRAKLKERYGDQVPLDEPVIAPVAIHESRLLRVVARR
jgi:uncharacterized protein YycO